MQKIYVLLSWLLLISMTNAVHASSIDNTYRLGAGDKIEISVYGEPDLTIHALYINNSGRFDYPYLGRLSALDKTPEQLKSEITAGLKGDYLIAPKVRVSVIEFRSIYVNGEVKQPGAYEYQPGLTVDKAIALAGGFTDRAARTKIFVTKSGSADKASKYTLTQAILPGDIIVIKQSFF